MDSVILQEEQTAMRARIVEAAQPPVEKPQPIRIPSTPTLEELNNRSTDVVPYVRHKGGCRSKKDDCGCPLWLYDRLSQKRFAARTTVWQKAKDESQRIMDLRDPVKARLAQLEKKREQKTVPIQTAINEYEKDCKVRGLAPETIEAYLATLEQMRDFAHGQRIFSIGDITPQMMKDWRANWPDKEKSSKQKKQRQIKTFFKWVCEQMKWIEELNDNPALALTTIKGDGKVAAVPFEDDQFAAILDATYIYEDSKRFRNAANRLRALILLMRWSGLAIRDALTLERWRIDDEGILKVRRTKTKVWVELPIPLDVVEVLRALPNENPEYFFWNGSAKKRSLVGNYNRMLLRLFKLVKWATAVEDGEKNAVSPHSHMFRHTFAYWWLNTLNSQTGLLGDIRDLQILLGHRRLATTEKHYSGFMPNQNVRLNAEVRARHGASAAKGKLKLQPPAPQPEHHIRLRIRQRSHRQ